MSCYKPKKAFPLLVWNKDKDILEVEKTRNNKINYYITDYNVKHIYMTNDGVWHKSYDDFVTKMSVIVQDEFIEIPCGSCVGCRLDHSNMWANRCMLESKYHKSNYFVTLTYNEDSLNEVDSKGDYIRRTEYINDETGEVLYPATLNKRDMQLFMKRLRKACEKRQDEKIRFFGCGEYGSHTLRPHFHLILFGLELNDLVVHSVDSRGYNLYTSDFLQRLWPYGFVTVGDCNVSSCAYVARYCVKKAFKSNSVLVNNLNVEPEFLSMSTHPGIARRYYEEHPNLFDFDFINISTEDGGIKMKPPRYFEKLYDNDHPVKSADEIRKSVKKEMLDLSGAYKTSKLERTSLDYLQMLKVEEDNKINQIKALSRNL